MKRRYYSGVLSMIRPKFVTLTLRKTGRIEDRLGSIWDLRKYLFKTLTRRGYEIRSWIGVVEPPNHIHLIVDCDYIPQHEMKEIWQRITGDSFIVGIERVPIQEDPQRVLNYITGYFAKVSNYAEINVGFLQGFHLAGSWGLPAQEKHHLACSSCEFEPIWIRVDIDAWYAMGGRGHVPDKISPWKRLSARKRHKKLSECSKIPPKVL